MDVFEQIREACADVTEKARHVRLVADRITSYTCSLPLESATSPALDEAHHFVGPEAETVAFVLTLDAVNFGSGYFPHLAKLPGLSGYFTVATRLTERFRRQGPWSARELATMTPMACSTLFEQDPENVVINELMELFARAWSDLGQLLLERFGGDPCRLVAAAEHSAARLVALLAEMPFYRDVARWRGREVPLYKRAQLSVADLSLALGGRGYGLFADVDRLTIFADNLIPHVLRLDGVLEAEPTLVARIAAGELITPGSEEEVELRATAVHAVELIRDEAVRARRPITSVALDYLLWNRGQGPDYKASPRHRARSVFY